jgi:hypothetical protein
VIEVTSLADSGPGTLRAAVEDPSPRTVVFRVGGTIELESEIQIGHPFITIAGQTAPGGGICLRNAGVAVSTHDVLIQYLRFCLAMRAASMRTSTTPSLSWGRAAARAAPTMS